MIEPLETRIAPAILVNPSTVTFQDFDGDIVTVKLTKPVLTAANFGTVFSFVGGNLTDNNTPQILNVLALYQLGDQHNGLGVTITAKTAGGGDGRVKVLNFDARNGGNGLDLGVVKVDGDIGKLTAGDGNAATPAIASLTADTIGVSAYASAGTVIGSIGTLKTRGDFQTDLTVQGDIGRLMIGGSLRPSQRLSVGSFEFTGGTITTTGDVGSAKIRGNIMGTLSSGDGVLSVGGRLGSLSIGGSIVGDASFNVGVTSGAVTVGTGGIGNVFVGGSLLGGSAQNSGSIISLGNIGNVVVRGSLVGGSQAHTGSIEAGGKLGNVSIGGDLRGGSGSSNTADIAAATGIGNVTIGGSVVGGGNFSARIVAFTGVANIGKVLIKGSLLSDSGIDSGLVFATGSIAGVTVKGDVATFNSGSTARIYAGVSIGPVLIGGDLESASILAGIVLENPRRYGDANDAWGGNPSASIASVIVKGTARSVDLAAIEAHRIGKLVIGGVNYSRTNPALNFATGFDLDSTPANTFLVREL